MKNYIGTAAALAIIWIGVFTFAALSQHDVTVRDSEWGCCSIKVDKTDKVVTYTNLVDLHKGFSESYSTDSELEGLINSCEDICYYEHN